MKCDWLFSGAGYYNYEQGYRPVFEGEKEYGGEIVHPQHWPNNFIYKNKRIVIIGSGATAVTLVPALASDAKHVTMLQRTPTYIVSQPLYDPIARVASKIFSPATVFKIMRYLNAKLTITFWKICQKYPRFSKKLLMAHVKRNLPPGYPVHVHFNPPYNPWDQRLCTVPDGDLFYAIKSGKADIITDRIKKSTKYGILLESGKELSADVIIVATGLNIQFIGGVRLKIDGQEIAFNECVVYKGFMLSGVPNFAFAVGYTNSSWTLKVCLISKYLCNLLEYMDNKGYRVCKPRWPDDISLRPLLDFGAGYVKRSLHEMPRQGDKFPWTMSMDYFKDIKVYKNKNFNDDALIFE
ncbi:NAD(P)/FAD-dependent oxidoreductase [Tepidimonas taiwanensis]|uniref:flavin-containing monooxygenase n=1 Tax=Tepidimonas taiwanensis TaxID=307486 RepID=UPI001CCBF59A|nr:NAD(P)/FAD-dependent oxidoreductase [Tepidimonas taiwanensis]UBQ06795.1 NAD(P)/FAD-dependent oxidoreductase [Tepidimonas taiwanensis]